MDDRQSFASAFGAIMSFVGVAVGLGNVWRFPYMASAFGGGAFLLIYFLLLVIFGVPALMAELTLGRMTRRGPLSAFASAGMLGGRVVGWALFVTVLMAASYYSVVVGWVLEYVVISVTGDLVRVEPGAFFDQVLGGFWGQFFSTAAIILGVAVVLLTGIKSGIERVSGWGVPLLFGLFVLLMVRALTLPGAFDGLKFYLWPDFSRIDSSVVAAALGQVFFSLGLGGTFLLTYASYLPDHANIRLSAFSTGLGDGLASIFAGLIIVPVAFTLGVPLESGPSLTFLTMPAMLARMPAGALFAVLFFALLLIAAYLSNVAAFEVLITSLVDELRWKRRRAIVIICAAELALATLSMKSLDFLLKNDLIWGSTMQPIGSAMVMVALAWFVGLQRTLRHLQPEAETSRLNRIWFYWMKFAIPLGIVVILALGIKDVFNTFVR